MAFLIFKTKKKDDESVTFVGQSGNNKLSTVSKLTQTATNQDVTHITAGQHGKTGVTDDYFVDFIPKEDLSKEDFIG